MTFTFHLLSDSKIPYFKMAYRKEKEYMYNSPLSSTAGLMLNRLGQLNNPFYIYLSKVKTSVLSCHISRQLLIWIYYVFKIEKPLHLKKIIMSENVFT